MFIEGADLDPYRCPPANACWWCGSAGPLTQEHKFKRSDLMRMWGADGIVWGGGGEPRNIRSPRKSKHVRFGLSLCAACNNQRSQPFDFAWEKFSDYVWNHRKLWNQRRIDMKDVYGKTWKTDVTNLARYVVKHVGCRMIDDSFFAPPSFRDFLDGGEILSDVQMGIFKSPLYYTMYQKLQGQDASGLGLFIGPAAGAVSPSLGQLTIYSSEIVVNYIGIMYRWEYGITESDPFYRYRRPALHNRDELPKI